MIVLVWYTAWMRQSSTWLSDLEIGHCHIAILSLGPRRFFSPSPRRSGQVQTSGPIVCGSTPKAFKHLRESLHYHKFYKDRAEIGPAKLAKWAKLFRENAQNAQNWRGHYKKNLAGAWFPMFDHDQLNRVETSALEQLLFATGCLSRSHSACNQASCLLLLHAFSGIRTPLLGAVRFYCCPRNQSHFQLFGQRQRYNMVQPEEERYQWLNHFSNHCSPARGVHCFDAWSSSGSSVLWWNGLSVVNHQRARLQGGMKALSHGAIATFKKSSEDIRSFI